MFHSQKKSEKIYHGLMSTRQCRGIWRFSFPVSSQMHAGPLKLPGFTYLFLNSDFYISLQRRRMCVCGGESLMWVYSSHHLACEPSEFTSDI